MDLNYVRRFSAYVSTFYHSEYITILYTTKDCIWYNGHLATEGEVYFSTMTV